MTVRWSVLSSAAVAFLALTSVAVAGQARTGSASSEPALRTAWGQPDLQGVWDFRTITPMERPDDLVGKEFLTPEEAAELEETRRAENAARDGEVPADIVGNYNTFWFDRGSSVVGTQRTSLVLDPPDGKIPPLTPQAELLARGRGSGAERHGTASADTGWLGGRPRSERAAGCGASPASTPARR